jgi:hypothetical protein
VEVDFMRNITLRSVQLTKLESMLTDDWIDGEFNLNDQLS